MAAFGSLSNEILEKICHHLSNHHLASLSRVSKATRLIFEPFLYQDIDFCWHDTTYFPPLHLLVRTLIRRPSLCQHVHKLILRAKDPYRQSWWWRIGLDTRDFSEDVRETLSDNDISIMKSAIASLFRARQADHWQERLDFTMHGLNDKGVFVALLIALLSKLRVINVDTEFNGFVQDLWAVTRQDGSSGNHPFPHLRTVALSCDLSRGHNAVDRRISRRGTMGSDGFSLPRILALFSYPSMKSVTFSVPPWHLHWPLGMQPTEITSLALVRTHFPVQDLSRILALTPALRRLDYCMQFDCGYYSGNSPDHVDLEGLGVALSYVKEKLKYLTLSIGYLSTLQDLTIDETPLTVTNWHGRLKVLHSFPELKKAKLPVAMLLGCDSRIEGFVMDEILPRTLETIILTDELLLGVMSDRLRSGLLPWIETFGDLEKVSLDFTETMLLHLEPHRDWDAMVTTEDFGEF